MKRLNKKKKIILIILSAVLAVTVLLGLIFIINDKFGSQNEITNDFMTGGSGTGAENGNRVAYNFNYGWTFSKGQGYVNSGTSFTTAYPKTSVTVIPNPTLETSEIDLPYSTTYDPTNLTGTSTWKSVSLPHTYNDEDTFNNFTESGLNGERTMYSGTAWYRKTFNLSSSYQTGKKVIIEFEGARQAAKVWINGNLLSGKSETGFIAFGYEIPTEYLHFGEGTENQNIITVMTDNSYPYYMDNTGSQISWHDSHWHPNYGGLYRNSYLYVVDDLHLTLPLYSFTQGQGTYIYTSDENRNTANVHISAEVKNSSNQSKSFTYQAIIKDMNGNEVATAGIDQAITLGAGETASYDMTTTITNIKRWSVNYPYLYTCEVKLLDSNNDVIDDNSNKFGIRTFRFTNDYGFYLNEYYTEVNGWGQKPTWEWAVVGAAYPDWMTEYGIKMLKEAGGNYIRWGHSAAGASQINMCDKYGVLVTQPGVDGEGQGGSGGVYDANTYRLRIEAMRDLIIYFRNHPSIIMWEMGNQSQGLQATASSSFLENIPWIEYDPDTYSTSTRTYAEILYDVINKYDYGNRPSTIRNAGSYANTTDKSDRLITIRHGATSTKDYVDVGETTEGSGGMNTASLGNKPNIEGEFNRLEARRGVWDKYTQGFTNFSNTSTSGSDYVNSTSESFATKQIPKRNTIFNNTYHVGGANWIFSDSISHGRLQSEASRVSGEIDSVMLPKQAYYVNQVINSKTTAMHIIGHWNYPAGTTKNIYVAAKGVYSVELFVNNVSKGTGTLTNSYLYTFNNIDYEAGTLKAVGYDVQNNPIITKEITTHKEPNKIRITKVNTLDNLYANGSDILILDVELLDEDNNRCVSYDGEVNNSLVEFTYNLTDNGKTTGEFLGGHNSGVPSNNRTDNIYLEAGITRVFVRTTMNEGAISVTATMGNMTDTYQTTSTEIMNDNGLSTITNQTMPYSFSATEDQGLGDGSKLGLNTTTQVSNTKLYIENLSYSGTANDNNGIDDAFTRGIKLYSDNATTALTVPYKFSNAEMLRLPNDDNGVTADDLIVFNVTRNSTIFVARDPGLEEPSWLTSEYTKTDDIIMGSNSINYEIWEKNVSAGTTMTIGGNCDDGSEGVLGYNQFVFVKETTKYTNRIFFDEDFTNFTTSNIVNGYNAITPTDTKIELATQEAKTGLYFNDVGTDIGYIQKKFAKLDRPFTFEYKAYINTLKNNTWIRVFLSMGKITDVNNKKNVPIESYLFYENGGVSLKYKLGDTTKVALTSMPINTWLTYKYYVNPINKKWSIKVYNGSTLVGETPTYNFSVMTYLDPTINTTIPVDNVDHFTIGTGVSYTSDFYIDDISITPEMDLGATNITVNDTTITFDKSITSYIIPNSGDLTDATVSLTRTDDYYDSTITKSFDKIDVDLENQQGEHYIFEVRSIALDTLNGWIYSPSSPSSSLGVSAELKDNNETIYFKDTSTTESVYASKEITPNETALKFSFDILLDDDISFNQEMLRIFLSNGEMPTQTNYQTLAIRSYLTPQQETTNEYLMTMKQTSGVDSSIMDDTIITKNTWHKIEYYVNLIDHLYAVYLDGNLLLEEHDFYSPEEQIDHIYFGTDVEGTGSFYIKDVVTEEAGGTPLEGITIDQNVLGEFDQNSDSYTYYTDTTLTNNTEVLLITNSLYQTSTITKDIENQQIVINISDTLGNNYTYTITYEDLTERPITETQLQTLVDEALALDAENYTFNTWDILANSETGAIKKAQDVLANPGSIPKEYSLAYYDLEQAINNLLYLCTYTGYDSANVETIRYSSNLKDNENNEYFNFTRVLDNDKQIYMNDATNLFTSVPYKYMNAEFLSTNNENYRNGLIVLEPLQNIDVLVFKDRDTGPLVEPGYEYTGEIATSTNGVVYKIYKKSFTTDTDYINIEYNKLINNEITNINNIVAFIRTTDANNNTFIDENFNEYNQTLFNKAWEAKTSNNASNVFQGDIGGTDNYVNLISTSIQGSSSTYGWGMVYKEMAKLNEQIVFKYKVNLTSFALDSSHINKFSRTWLRQGEGIFSIDNNAINADKALAAVDFYIQNNTDGATNGTIAGTTKTSGKVAAPMANINNKKIYFYNNTKQNYFGVNNWYEVEIRMNFLTRQFQVVYDGDIYPSATTYLSMNNGASPGNNSALTYVDYVYFGSRAQGASDFKIKDVVVYPVASNVFSDITISDSSIGNYQDFTKAYLYQTATKTAFDDVTPSVVDGTLVTSDGNTTTPTIATSTVGTEKYSTIEENYVSTSNGTYNRNYKVYYEVDTDTTDNENYKSKSDLVTLIQQANKINSKYYTTESYNDLMDEVTNSINLLADHDAEFSDVTTTYNTLKTSYDNLVPLINTTFKYNGKIRTGKQYDTFENQEVNITNNSSLTANFSFETRLTEEYENSNKEHDKYLKSDIILPAKTKITMIDNLTNNIYYYTVSSQDVTNEKISYALSDFTLIGTTNSKYQNTIDYDSTTKVLQSDYSFIIDFEDTTNGVHAGTHTLEMETYVESEKITQSDSLSYKTYTNRTSAELEISLGKEYYHPKEEVIINANATFSPIVVGGKNVTDTTLIGKNMGARLRLYDSNDDLVSFPKGTKIEDGANTYTLSPDGIIYGTRGNILNNTNVTFNLLPGYKGIEPGEYTLKTDFFESYDGINFGKIIVSAQTPYLIEAAPSCSISAIVDNNTNVIDVNRVTELDVEIKTTCNYSNDNQIITLSLYKKSTSVFNDFEYQQLDYFNYVNNSIATPYAENVYKITEHENNNLSKTSYTDNFAIHLKKNIPSGLYKIRFNITAGDLTNEDEVTFSVK